MEHFCQINNPKLNLTLGNYPKEKNSIEIPCATGKNIPYDVIIGRYSMKELQTDVLYSEDVVVWGGVRLPMQKI